MVQQSAKIPVVQLREEAQALLHAAVSAPGGHRGKSWPVGKSLRLMLVALVKGATLPTHENVGALSIQVLQGSLRLSAPGFVKTLAEQEVATLEPGAPHALESLTDAVILITVAAPLAALSSAQ